MTKDLFSCVIERHLGVNGEGVSMLPRCLVNLLPNRIIL